MPDYQVHFSDSTHAVFPEIGIRAIGTDIAVQTLITDGFVFHHLGWGMGDTMGRVTELLNQLPWAFVVEWQFTRREEIGGGSWQVNAFIPLLTRLESGIEVLHA